MSWSNDLDMLAQAGVINFDAPSYIYGQTPRYVGNPAVINPFSGPGAKPTLPEQPKIDEFQSGKNDGNIVDNPVWKKVLFSAIAIGGLIFLGFKGKKGLSKAWDSIKKFFTGKSTPSTGKTGWWSSFKTKASKCWAATKKGCEKGWDATKTFCSDSWKKFTGLFKKKSTP